jgi:hypothetical protein
LCPDVVLRAHVALLDILVYTPDPIPESFRNGMFLRTPDRSVPPLDPYGIVCSVA